MSNDISKIFGLIFKYLSAFLILELYSMNVGLRSSVNKIWTYIKQDYSYVELYSNLKISKIHNLNFFINVLSPNVDKICQNYENYEN